MSNRTTSHRQRDAAMIAELQMASRRGPHWSASLLLISVFVFILAFIFWAMVAELDQVTTGTGKVIPSGKVQVIQNLEGGIVEEILVSEGEMVREGQVILRLDPTSAAASFRGNRAEYLGLIASRARLKAEVEGSSPRFPQEVHEEAPHLIASEIALFNGRRKELQASLDVLGQQRFQREQDLGELESKLISLRRAQSLLSQEMAMTEPNVAAGIVSERELLRLRRELSDTDGEIEQIQHALSRARSAINEARRRIQEKRSNYRSEALRELAAIEAVLGKKSETIKAQEDRLDRTEVRAPRTGVIKNLGVHTLGGVVQPGEPFAELVPVEETLLVEAQISPSDIAFLASDQKARVKITAYDFVIYGSLDGTLEHISPDAIVNERGESFYRIYVRTDRNYLGTEDDPLPIKPGMVAEVSVLTGKTTVMSYLLKPLLRMREKALTQS